MSSLVCLLRGLLALEHVTSFDNSGRIDCDVSFVDVADDSFFINQEGGAISKALLLVEHAIVFDDRALEITEYGERNSNLLCKLAVGGNTVNTHTEDLSVG